MAAWNNRVYYFSFHGSSVRAQHNWNPCLESHRCWWHCVPFWGLQRRIYFLVYSGCWKKGAMVSLLPHLSTKCLLQCLKTTHSHPFSYGLFIFKPTKYIQLFSHFFSSQPLTFAFFCLPLLPLAWQRYLLLRAHVMKLGLFKCSLIS